MANRSGSKGLLHGRLKLLAVTAVVVAGLIALAVWLPLGFGVFTLHREVSYSQERSSIRTSWYW